ncbi:MAG: hypothetical protein ACI9QD_000166 [Thermoproteota archaeon]|jgi:hypothetical protein
MKFTIKVLFIILLLSKTVTALATELQKNCFTIHLKEAIKQNKVRKKLYNKLTQNKSRRLSNLLIRSETFTLAYAKTSDLRARKFQKLGIPILCDDFVSMDLTPDFGSLMGKRKPLKENFYKVNIKTLKKKLKRTLKNKGLKSFSHQVESILHVLAKEPKLNCMLRHVLESVLRSSNMAVRYDEYASLHNLKSPLKFSKKMIKGQFTFLNTIHKIDVLALPIQLKGIPIICQDVPPILPYSDF